WLNLLPVQPASPKGPSFPIATLHLQDLLLLGNSQPIFISGRLSSGTMSPAHRQSCDRCRQQKVRCLRDNNTSVPGPGGVSASLLCDRCAKAGADCVYSGMFHGFSSVMQPHCPHNLLVVQEHCLTGKKQVVRTAVRAPERTRTNRRWNPAS